MICSRGHPPCGIDPRNAIRPSGLSTSNPLPLILLPGMGTDALVFALQSSAFPQIVVPPWLPPEPRESLADYAGRMANRLDITGPCVVGGLSFGGMVALELTKHLDARGCILISSLRGREELPWWIWGATPWVWLLPPRADRYLAGLGQLLLATLGPVMPRGLKSRVTHLGKLRTPLFTWASRAVVGWRASANGWPCPVFQIHGTEDWVFPRWRVRPDELVPRGGHHLTLTHPFAVNAFIRKALETIAAEGRTDAPAKIMGPISQE